MFYVNHTMQNGYIVRTYHEDGETIPTLEEIQSQYDDGFIEGWCFVIDPDGRFAEVVFENFSLRETVGTCHCEEVSWINAETNSNHNYEDVKECQNEEV